MAKCKDITPSRKSVCIGSLRYRVKIYDRAIASSGVEGTAEHSEGYTLFKTVFANIQTIEIRTLQTMDGVMIDPDLVVTHTFIVRYLSTLNTEQYVVFKGKNYKILKAENVDEADEWLRLKVNLRGDFTKAGAQ